MSAVAEPAPAPSRAALGDRFRHLAAPTALAMVVFILAVVPRTMGTGLFVTSDEDNWMRRGGSFARAVLAGDLQGTFQSGHPGVVTMWLTWLGLGADATRFGVEPGGVGNVTRVPGFLDALQRARHAFALVNALLVASIALLTWRLLGPGPAAAAGALLALDPFLVAHGQVVHLDALSTGFITVAILSGAIYWWSEQSAGRGYLALCAVATGLAVLTKAPSLSLGLFLPVLAVSARLAGRGGRSWPGIFGSLVVCGLGTLATVLVLWPALWVAPVQTVERGLRFAAFEAGRPHDWGSFFLGQPIGDPGPFFYPVVVGFRLTPLAFVGLLAFALLARSRAPRWPTLVLLGYVLGFTVVLTLASKKLDRYALPLFPALDILAGTGLWLLWRHASTQVRGLDRLGGGRALLGAVLVVAAAQSPAVLSVRPYALAYYNPLLGGGPAAERAIVVGWGEGLDQVAAYLNAQPDAGRSRVAIYLPLVANFQGSLAGPLQSLGSSAPTTYVVDYVNGAQRGQTPREVVGRTPDHTVWINGIRYARIYRLPEPTSLAPIPPVVPRGRSVTAPLVAPSPGVRPAPVAPPVTPPNSGG